MSIAMQDYDGSSLDFIREKRRTLSVRRLEANRRNARKSTGPRTEAGKKRASRNSMKHGLCAMRSHLPTECAATFHTFVAELEEELQPRTPLQQIIFDQIANLTWRLQRLPEAQTRLFAEEINRIECEKGEEVTPADVLARRFSEAPSDNGFALMDRYERQMRNALFRLFRQFDQLKKHRATVPYGEEARGQVLYPERACQPYEPDEPDEVRVETEDAALPQRCAEESGSEATSAERTQSNPPPIPDSESPAGKWAPETHAPVTERTQRDQPSTEDCDVARSVPVAVNDEPVQSAGHPGDASVAPPGSVESSTGMGGTPLRLNRGPAHECSRRTDVSPVPVKCKRRREDACHPTIEPLAPRSTMKPERS